MSYYRTFFGCLAFLLITACDTPQQLTADKKSSGPDPVEIKSIEMQPAVINTFSNEASEEESAKLPSPGQRLNLSIDNITLQAQQKDEVRLFNDYEPSEEHSILFDELSRKQPASHLSLSGELLTDENRYETKDILKSVDGIHIRVQGNFN